MKYGISPLHTWIRDLELSHHLEYKIDVKKWRISHNSPEAVIVKEKKIQQEVRLILGILVVMWSNAGTTNDGNTTIDPGSRWYCIV